MNLKDTNFDEELNSTDKFVLVDFFATWCEPCSVLGPVIEKVAEHFKEKVVLAKANVDNFPIISQRFNIDRIPTVILFKGGEKINGFTGLMPEEKIKEWLGNIIKENTKKS